MKYHKDDMEFVKKCCSGDSVAWKEFNNKYTDNIRISIISNSKCSFKKYSKDEIDDLIQTVIAKLIENNYEKLTKYNGSSLLKTWLSTVSVHIVIDEYRRKKKYFENEKNAVSLLEEVKDKNGNVTYKERVDKTQKDPFEIALNTEISASIDEGVNKLTYYEKVIFKLKYGLGLTQKQISNILKRKQGTIGSDISRVANKIKQCLRKYK